MLYFDTPQSLNMELVFPFAYSLPKHCHNLFKILAGEHNCMK